MEKKKFCTEVTFKVANKWRWTINGEETLILIESYNIFHFVYLDRKIFPFDLQMCNEVQTLNTLMFSVLLLKTQARLTKTDTKIDSQHAVS